MVSCRRRLQPEKIALFRTIATCPTWIFRFPQDILLRFPIFYRLWFAPRTPHFKQEVKIKKHLPQYHTPCTDTVSCSLCRGNCTESRISRRERSATCSRSSAFFCILDTAWSCRMGGYDSNKAYALCTLPIRCVDSKRDVPVNPSLSIPPQWFI